MITTEDLALINRYSAQVKADASAIGLTLHYSSDPHSFVEFLGKQESTHGISSAHNPELTDLRRKDFAWLCAKDEAGSGVFSHALVVVETESFLEDIITHRLFGNIEVPDHWEDVELYDEARERIAALDIRGRVALAGGMWVAPPWRHKGLPALLRKVLRVTQIPRLNWRHYVSQFQNTEKRTAWAMDDSWNTSVFPLLHGFYPAYGERKDIIMSHVTVEETLAFLRET